MRSSSPAVGAKKAMCDPASVSVFASLIANCRLPWNASDGRVAIWKLFSVSSPISMRRVSTIWCAARQFEKRFPTDHARFGVRILGRGLQTNPEAIGRRRGEFRFVDHDNRLMKEIKYCRLARLSWREPVFPNPRRLRPQPEGRARAGRPRACGLPAPPACPATSGIP